MATVEAAVAAPADDAAMARKVAPALVAYPATRVVDSEFGQALVAAEDIAQGKKVFRFQGSILDAPNMHTVQLAESKHILCTGGPEFTSHACDPNSYFVFDDDMVELVTLRPVRNGEALSFDYNTTEWDMSVKFRCLCKSARCYQVVQGYKHLGAPQRALIEAQLSPFIRLRRKLEEAAAALPGAPSTPAPAPLLAPVAVLTPGDDLAVAAATAATAPLAYEEKEEKARGEKILYKTAVVEAKYGKALIATEDIPVGAVVYRYTFRLGEMLDAANMHTVQVSEGKHIMLWDGPEFTCHSCVPNGHMRISEDGAGLLDLVAIRAIPAGQQITFDYNTTEWDMSVKFPCMCGEPACYRMVAGYSHLTREQRVVIAPYLTPYIRSRASEPVGVSVVFPTATPASAPVAAATPVAPSVTSSSVTAEVTAGVGLAPSAP